MANRVATLSSSTIEIPDRADGMVTRSQNLEIIDDNDPALAEDQVITSSIEKDLEINGKTSMSTPQEEEDCDTNCNITRPSLEDHVDPSMQTPPKRIKLCEADVEQEKDLNNKFNTLKKKVNENKEKLRKLKLAKTYKMKQSGELDELIKKWRRASQDALVELSEHAEQNATVGDILGHYNIDHKLIRYDLNKGLFTDHQMLEGGN